MSASRSAGIWYRSEKGKKDVLKPGGMLIMANGGKENVNMYATLIERYLKNEDISHSESEIAKEVLSVALDTNNDIPSSTNDLDKLTQTRESLRMLLSQGKIFQTLIQDPFTKEETAAYYGLRKT